MAQRVDLDTAIAEYLERHRDEQKTFDAYSQTLRQAQKMLAAMGVTKAYSIQLQHVEKLFFSVDKGWPSRRPRLSIGTMNNHRGRLRAFFVWCVGMGYMQRNFIHGKQIDRFKGGGSVKRRFTHAELRLIFDGTKHPRDRALAAAAGYTGLRVGELVSLPIGAIDFGNAELRYWDPKGKKWKTKPCYTEFLTEMQTWLEVYRTLLGAPLADDMLLFPRVERPTYHQDGGGWTPWSQRAVYPYEPYTGHNKMLNTLLDKLDLEHELEGGAKLNRPGQAWHMFRRSVGRLMYDQLAAKEGSKDKALRMVQAFYGHATRAITEHYIGLDTEQEELSEFVKGQNFHPDDPDTTKAELPTNVFQLRRGA